MNLRSRTVTTAAGVLAVPAALAAFASATGWTSLDIAPPDPILLMALAFALVVVLLAVALSQLTQARRTIAQQDDIRQQALALAQCMKDLTRRMSGIEANVLQAQAATALSEAPGPALAVTTEMEMPAPEVALPFAAPALPDPEPAPAGPPPRIVAERIVNLPHRRLIGYDIGQTPPEANAEAHVAALFTAALTRLQASERSLPQGIVRVSLGRSMAGAPQALALLERELAERPLWRSRLLVGLTQASIQTSGDDLARAIGRLSALGVGFCLTDITRLALDSGALKACGFRQVRIDARTLVAEFDHAEDNVDQFSRSLAADGLALVCDGVDDERLIPELIDLGVAQVSGQAIETSSALPAVQRLAS